MATTPRTKRAALVLEETGTEELPVAGGAVNPLESLLGYQLRRASYAMLADLSAVLATLDMRVIEASVLLVIQANPDITQSEIGRTLGIQRANMVPLTTQLERRGLIARGPLVGRAQALRLTRKGETLASKCRAGVDAHEARFRQRFSGEEHASLVAQLRKLWEGS